MSILNKIVVASHNEGKVREIRELLIPYGVTTISAAELSLDEPVTDVAYVRVRLVLQVVEDLARDEEHAQELHGDAGHLAEDLVVAVFVASIFQPVIKHDVILIAHV